MPDIKKDVEFISTTGKTEKVNIHILDLVDYTKVIKKRKELLNEMDSPNANPGEDAYELANKEATVYYSCRKDDGTLYFSSIKEMQQKLIDTSLYKLYSTYKLFKQLNDNTLPILDDDSFAEVIQDMKERGDEEISPFWHVMPPLTQYVFALTLVRMLDISLREKLHGTSYASDTSYESTVIGPELPSE